MWLLEAYARTCDGNNIKHTEPDRLECQKLCELNADCVGISYTNSELYQDVCYVCLDDILTSDNDGFDFYRKEGMYYTPMFFEILKIYRVTIFNMKIVHCRM